MAAVVVGLWACGEPSGIAPPTLEIVSPRQNDSVLAGSVVVFRADVSDAASPSGDVVLEWATDWGLVLGHGDSTMGVLSDTGTYEIVLLARQGAAVLATDRVRVTVLPNAPPAVVMEPVPQPCLPYVTDTLRLVAHAADAESEPRVEWLSDRAGLIGRGDTLRWVPGQGAEGQHLISVRAIDPEGNRDEALTVVRVLGGPRFRWAREYPAVDRVAACGGASDGAMLPLALADDGTVLAAVSTAVWSLTGAGDVRWSFPSANMNEHFAGIVVGQDGTAFFANYDGVFHALGPDGAVRWSAALLHGDWHGRPAMAPDGALYVTGRSPATVYYHDLVRVDPATGGEVWRLHLARGGNMSSVGILPDGNLVQTNGLWMLQVTPAGAVARADSTGVDFRYVWYGMSAFDTAGTGYHPIGSSLTAVRRDHTVAWTNATLSASEPVVGADGAVYAASGNTVWRLGTDGGIQWSAPHPGAYYLNSRIALLADGTLWVAAGRFLTRLDAATGAQLDQVELADDVSSAPAVAGDGTLYVMTGGNRIVAIDGGAPLDPLAPWPTWRRDNRRTASVPRP